jgi:YidC/Oxa1 family membrane protein insertase
LIDTIAKFLGEILLFFYNNTGQNYGLAIILLTLVVRLVTWPLTSKQLSSAKAMQDMQPEIKKLQEKYKDDKEKLNQATMELWKTHKVNPAAGCLPLLLQFPVLIAMFRLLQQPALLEGIENVIFLTMNMTVAAVADGIWQTNPGYYIMVILSGITTYLQQKLMMTDKSQQTMMIIMPFMILFFSVRFPAGLVLYWVINNFLSVGHHYFLNKPSAKGAVSEK